MPDSRFYIEKPQDQFGNRGMSCEGKYPIVKGVIIEKKYGPTISVLEPVDFPWPTISPKFMQEVSEEVGPARYVGSVQMLDDLISKYAVKGVNAATRSPEDQNRATISSLVSMAMEKLKEKKAPTSIGYNDIALMFALVQVQYDNSEITPELISRYLKQHPEVPKDARMAPEQVESYLELLKNIKILEVGSKGYTMRREIATSLCDDFDIVKTKAIKEVAIRGISLFALINQP